jgi:hypothetical protein
MKISYIKDVAEEVDRGGVFVPQIERLFHRKLLQLQGVANAPLTLSAENGYVESGLN